MTGSSAAGPVRLALREPPHLLFIQGWPGIPSTETRQAARVEGAVEVRVSQPVKAKWVRVEIRKYEALPSGPVSKSSLQPTWEHVGKVHLLWRASEGKEFDLLSTTDFRFVIPLPLDLPPSVELSKVSGVRYELVASVCYKGKGGLFKKDASQVTNTSQTIRVIKYDLASAWPLYNQPEQRSQTASNGQLTLIVDRNCRAFGPGDPMLITVTVKNIQLQAFKVKSIELVLTEVLTIFPPAPDPNATRSKKAKAPQPPAIKRAVVAQARTIVGEFIGPGTETKGSIELVVPTSSPLLTVRAKEFSIEYELSAEASLETNPNRIAVMGMPCIIGPFSRSSAQQAVKDIGFVDGLCPGGSAAPQPSLAAPPAQSALLPQSVYQNLTPNAAAANRQSPSPGVPGGGFLGVDPQSRPTSMQPARRTPSPGPPPSQPPPAPQQLAPSPPSSPPQVQGFTPRGDFRRSSSGTTVTSNTLAQMTGADHNPLFFNDRSSMTMPVNRRTSHSPNINGEDHQFGGSLRNHRQSSQSDHQRTNSFGAWNSSVYECIVDTDERSNTGHSNSGHSRTPSLSIDPRSAPPTAQTPSLPQILDEVPDGLPPEYAPPSKPEPPRTASPQAMGADSGFGSSSAGSSSQPQRSNPQHGLMSSAQEKEQQRQRYEMATQQRNPVNGSASGSAGPSSPNGYDRATSPPASATTGGFAANQARVSSPIANASQHTSPGPSVHGHTDDPIPYDDLFGPTSASPAPAPAPAPRTQATQVAEAQSPGRGSPSAASNPASQLPAQYKSVVDEKARMRQRYEDAQRAVSFNQANYESPTESAANSFHDHDPEVMSSAPAPLTMVPQGMKLNVHSGLQAHVHAAMLQSQQNFGRGTPGGSSHASTPPPNRHMSAEEEKDEMRRRYEAAQGRVVSAQNLTDVGSPGSGPSAHSPPAGSSSGNQPPAAYMSAAEEKAAMRARYEQAQQAVASHASPSPPPPSSPPPIPGGSSRPPQSMSPVHMSAAEEKELMRQRYEAAQQRVTSASRPPQQDRRVSSPRAGGSMSPPPMAQSQPYMSVAEEKEMMKRRYEDATSRVARAADSPSGPSGPSSSTSAAAPFIPFTTPSVAPLSYDEIFTSTTGGSGSHASTPAASAPSVAPQPYMSAADEKAMMRKRYADAQNAVARAAGSDSPVRSPGLSAGGSGSGSRAPIDDGPIPYDAIFPPAGGSGSGSGSGTGPSALASGSSREPVPQSPPYLSAEQEKEQMRRRYEEAQHRVARAAGSASPPPMMHQQPMVVSPTKHMSAEQEKDLMRRRYEEATNAVRQNTSSQRGTTEFGGSGSGSGGYGTGFGGASGSGSGSGSGAAASGSGSGSGTMRGMSFSAASPGLNGNGGTYGNGVYDSSSASGSGATSPISAVAQGKRPSVSQPARQMTVLPDGPPPPLAPRPPKEYIERMAGL